MASVSDQPKFPLATRAPTPGQTRLAVTVAIIVVSAFAITMPFRSIPLPPTNAFVPTIGGICFVNDFITAVLLFSQFAIIRSRSILVLACGYLFAALMVVPFALTFPGAFSPTGLLGAGPQSAAVLYATWHVGFSLSLLAFAWLSKHEGASKIAVASTAPAIGWSAGIVVGVVCGIVWFVTAEPEDLPEMFSDNIHFTDLVRYAASIMVLILILAIVFLWKQRRSLLNQWLIVVALAVISELVLAGASHARYDLGFFGGRLYTVVSSVIVLAVLLVQTIRLDNQLAQSNLMLEHERDNKMISCAAIAASISHEVRQPLMAITMNSGAALRFLEHAPPALDEVRSGLSKIIADSHRANQIFENIASLFKGGHPDLGAVDLNEVILGVLRIQRNTLKEQGVTTRLALTDGLPPVTGHPGQLQEVLLNLVQNAIDSMSSNDDRSRILRLTTERLGLGEIAVAVEDSGPGIDPKQLPNLFEAFSTSKAQGMGLGLAISQMIIERHGGQISASSDERLGGAIFRFVLPIRAAMGVEAELS